MGMLKRLFFAIAGLAALLIVMHFVLGQAKRVGGPVASAASWVDSHVNG